MADGGEEARPLQPQVAQTLSRGTVGRQRSCLRRRRKLRLSSDRGSQYTSRLLAEWAEAHDIRLSVGRTGSSYDDAVAESLFGTPETDWYHNERLLDAQTTKTLAIEYIESHHDRLRPHETVGDRIPAQLMEEFFERMDAAEEYEGSVEKAA